MRVLSAATTGRGLVVAAVVLVGAIGAGAAPADTDGPYSDVYYVNSCATGASINAAPVFSSSTFGLMQAPEDCPSASTGLGITAPAGADEGHRASWSAATPSPALKIIGVNSTGLADCNLHSDGFSADYFFGDGNVNYGVPSITVDCHGASSGEAPAGALNGFIQPSRYFGFQASCGQSTCASTAGDRLVFAATGITLAVQETSGPALTASGSNNLYNQSGWVRGTFAADLLASDLSGVCSMQTSVDGTAINSYSDPSRDTSDWSQCPGASLPATVSTTAYRNGAGAIALSFSAANAAGAVSSASTSVNVDNVTPSVSLSGPNDAPSTAGTQYVAATASAGPSGVADILCSVDGSPYTSYPGASAQVPVSGIGSHAVSCFAQNNSYDSSLTRASSPAAAWHLSIRQPTVSAITFGARVLDALRCHRARVKVRLPARWVTVHRHGRPVWVHRRAHTRTRRVVACHPRVVTRKIRVGRHVRRRRVVLLPHTVQVIVKHVGFRRTAVVSGWVGETGGTAVGGVPVEIIAAANNGRGHWRPATTATTNADGFWTAKLPAGPSRLVAAVYPGSGALEPATSVDVRVIVRTRIMLRIRPQIARWGRTVKLTGRVLGGYIPGGKLLRLRIGAVGVGFSATAGIPGINRRGYFHTGWTFGAGTGMVRYWFSVSTLAEPDYAYAPSSSRRVYVTVHG